MLKMRRNLLLHGCHFPKPPKQTGENSQDFTLSGKPAVTEANLRDAYYWKLTSDFHGLQSGEGLELQTGTCKNRVLIQVGLIREDNNYSWLAILDWLKKLFPQHLTADFRCLIERGVVTTLSLQSEARLNFLESDVNFNFVGPICDSIGVERQHLLEMRDFSERAKSIEVTNGLILELHNFISREKIAPIVIVSWLTHFNAEFCEDGNYQKAFKFLRGKIKDLKFCCRKFETRSHRRNAALESLLQTPFELVPEKTPDLHVKKPIQRDTHIEKVTIKEEPDDVEISQCDRPKIRNEGAEYVVTKEPGEIDESYASKTVEKYEKGEAPTLLDIGMQSVQKLSRVRHGKTSTCQNVSLDLLRNQYTLTCKEHPAMMEFGKKLDSLSKEVSLAPPVVFLNVNANFLVDLHDKIEQHIVKFEEEIVRSVGEKLGRDRLPKFKCFVNFQESATSRFIHMACDILNSCTHDKNYKKYWVAFCKEMKNPSKLITTQTNRVHGYFEAAAGLAHHHKEIAAFFSDLLSLETDECPNVILESVTADAEDSTLQSLVCVLAIIHCKVLGPYWQLLKSGGEYSLFSQYVLCLFKKLLEWSKDPSTLLQPEENYNVFLQFPLQEKAFEGVFQYCYQRHTNKDLIKAGLKRFLKVIISTAEQHLKDFLPGGKFGQTPSVQSSLQLVSCTFSVLMAEYPFGNADSHDNKSSQRNSSKRPLDSSSSDSSSGSSSGSLSEFGEQSDLSNEDSEVKANKGQAVKKEKPPRPTKPHVEPVLIMDKDYIADVVRKSGGPCRAQWDVDKMMLRLQGKSRAEQREAMRCEVLYQKMVLNNTSPHLNLEGIFKNTSLMVRYLKMALPRLKPSFDIILEPKLTSQQSKRQKTGHLETEHVLSESSSTMNSSDGGGVKE